LLKKNIAGLFMSIRK